MPADRERRRRANRGLPARGRRVAHRPSGSRVGLGPPDSVRQGRPRPTCPGGADHPFSTGSTRLFPKLSVAPVVSYARGPSGRHPTKPPPAPSRRARGRFDFQDDGQKPNVRNRSLQDPCVPTTISTLPFIPAWALEVVSDPRPARRMPAPIQTGAGASARPPFPPPHRPLSP